MFKYVETQNSASVDAIIEVGWYIMTTWIDPEDMCQDEIGITNNVSLIVTAS